MRDNITRSWSATALLYKPRILGLKNEEIPFLVQKLSVIEGVSQNLRMLNGRFKATVGNFFTD